MLFLLPKDILRTILQTYLNNKDANNLSKTCKIIYKIDYLHFLQNKNDDTICQSNFCRYGFASF